MSDELRAREAASLRALVDYYDPESDDFDTIVAAVKRLRAFLTGSGATPDYIEHAAALLVDRYAGGGA